MNLKFLTLSHKLEERGKLCTHLCTHLLYRYSYLRTQINIKNILKIILFAGADDVIAFNCDDNIYELEERDLLLKELSIRNRYDVIFLTQSQTYNRDFLYKFLTSGGRLIDTVEKRLSSDEYGLFMRYLCSVSQNFINFMTI